MDPDLNDTHTIEIVEGTPFPSISWIQGQTIYAFDADMEHLGAGESVDEFYVIKITDSAGASTTAQYTLTLYGSNDAPEADDIFRTMGEADPAIILAADFSDLDRNDTHTFSVNTTDTLGTVINNGDGTFSYDPDGAFDSLAENESAYDTFTYTVDDGHGGTDTATVEIKVTGLNDSPSASNWQLSAHEDDAPFFKVIGFDTSNPNTTSTNAFGNFAMDDVLFTLESV